MSGAYIALGILAVCFVVGCIVAYVYLSKPAPATAIPPPEPPTQPSGGLTQTGDQQDINRPPPTDGGSPAAGGKLKGKLGAMGGKTGAFAQTPGGQTLIKAGVAGAIGGPAGAAVAVGASLAKTPTGQKAVAATVNTGKKVGGAIVGLVKKKK